MVGKLASQVDFTDLDALRQRISAKEPRTAAAGAGQFVDALFDALASIVLVRMFLVLPFDWLPVEEQKVALSVADDAPIEGKTRVLSLLASRGIAKPWNDRLSSAGHRAIPLLNRKFVQGAPMIAKLLSELEVDLAGLDDGRPIATRKMLGGHNGTFFVPDAATARDQEDRYIIPGQDFVRDNGVKTVFGMGGAYADGTLAVAIVFTSELIARLQVDRFPSLISNFKMATAAAVSAHRFFDDDARR